VLAFSSSLWCQIRYLLSLSLSLLLSLNPDNYLDVRMNELILTKHQIKDQKVSPPEVSFCMCSDPHIKLIHCDYPNYLKGV
jgi:hypothetical protein